MNIEKIANISASRAMRWHNGDITEWSALEWAGAMAGEAGEACNAAKKLKRMESKIASINAEGRNYADIRLCEQAVAHECADTILYALLTMNRVGLTGAGIEELLCDVFNKKSEEYGFPERI